MKLQELKLDEWDGTFEEVFNSNNERIILLHLTNFGGLKEEGRRNLIKTDNDYNIIWIAEAPEIGKSFEWYIRFKIELGRYIAWYGGNVFVEINPQTGVIVKERFFR